MSVYLDASAILPTMIEEVGSPLTDAFIAAASEPIVNSEFTAAEVASAVSRLVRIGKLERGDADQRLADFDTWRAAATLEMDIQASDIRLAAAYVRRFDLMLRVPDALHAAACNRTGHQLVTLDGRLATAAVALGIQAIHLYQ